MERISGLELADIRIIADRYLTPEETPEPFERFMSFCKEIPGERNSARFNALFTELDKKVSGIARAVARRMQASSCIDESHEDWSQEVMISLWSVLQNGEHQRFESGESLRRYVNGILYNQAALYCRQKSRTKSLFDDEAAQIAAVPSPSTLEKEEQLEELESALTASVAEAERELEQELGELARSEAIAARTWLARKSLRKAAEAGGISLHRVRRVTFGLARGSSRLTHYWKQVRHDFQALYQAFPHEALDAWPRTLHRFISKNRQVR